MLRRAVLLSRDIHQRVACAQSSFRITPIRCIRTTKHGDEAKEQKSGEPSDSKFTGPKQDAKGNHQGIPPDFNMTPERMRRFGIFFIGSFIISSICSYLLFRKKYGSIEGFIVGKDEMVSFDVFVEKFLKAGEVKQIMFLTDKRIGIAYLHDGAIIDGKPFGKTSVTVKYDRIGAHPEQFQTEIRQIEQMLKIGPRESIPINIIQDFNFFRAIEFLLGVGVLFFLFMAYLRVAVRALARRNAKKASRPFQKKDN